LLTAASLLADTPDAIRDTYSDYDPQNFSHRYLGPVRVREALACSLNVPAIIALSQVGARSAFYELQNWGFDFPRGLDDYGAGFILGNAEIRLVDLAAAYAGLARGGLSTKPKLLASECHPMTRVASEAATEIIADILSDNEARRKSFGATSPGIQRTDRRQDRHQQWLSRCLDGRVRPRAHRRRMVWEFRWPPDA
jgi:penicillin-binding protein 1C